MVSLVLERSNLIKKMSTNLFNKLLNRDSKLEHIDGIGTYSKDGEFKLFRCNIDVEQFVNNYNKLVPTSRACTEKGRRDLLLKVNLKNSECCFLLKTDSKEELLPIRGFVKNDTVYMFERVRVTNEGVFNAKKVKLQTQWVVTKISLKRLIGKTSARILNRSKSDSVKSRLETIIRNNETEFSSCNLTFRFVPLLEDNKDKCCMKTRSCEPESLVTKESLRENYLNLETPKSDEFSESSKVDHGNQNCLLRIDQTISSESLISGTSLKMPGRYEDIEILNDDSFSERTINTCSSSEDPKFWYKNDVENLKNELRKLKQIYEFSESSKDQSDECPENQNCSLGIDQTISCKSLLGGRYDDIEILNNDGFSERTKFWDKYDVENLKNEPRMLKQNYGKNDEFSSKDESNKCSEIQIHSLRIDQTISTESIISGNSLKLPRTYEDIEILNDDRFPQTGNKPGTYNDVDKLKNELEKQREEMKTFEELWAGSMERLGNLLIHETNATNTKNGQCKKNFIPTVIEDPHESGIFSNRCSIPQ